jgi:hypothetical protein
MEQRQIFFFFLIMVMFFHASNACETSATPVLPLPLPPLHYSALLLLR